MPIAFKTLPWNEPWDSSQALKVHVLVHHHSMDCKRLERGQQGGHLRSKGFSVSPSGSADPHTAFCDVFQLALFINTEPPLEQVKGMDAEGLMQKLQGRLFLVRDPFFPAPLSSSGIHRMT